MAITRPPTTPVSVSVIRASEATFMPTCFMQQNEREPAKAAPMATSSETFSFTDHSA